VSEKFAKGAVFDKYYSREIFEMYLFGAICKNPQLRYILGKIS
jgi:hypothetical protein